MLYKAKQQLVHLIFLPLIIIQTTIAVSNVIIYFLYALFVFVLIGALVKYEFNIEDTSVKFKILLFRIPIYVQTVRHNEVIQIKFKRFGWYKGAKIKVKGKPNIRLSRFQPTKIYSDLNNFASKYNINTIKTKDFDNL